MKLSKDLVMLDFRLILISLELFYISDKDYRKEGALAAPGPKRPKTTKRTLKNT